MRKFRIALVNVFWSENDINTRYFESVSDQSAYFDELTRGNFSFLVNFNMGNNIETSVIYRDTSNRPVSELVASNYAVVQEVEVNEGSDEIEVINERYFFAYPSQDSGRQMKVTLSLDDIQTNYFKYKNQISPCLIKRANLNRWIDNGDDTISFNGNVDSPLFEAEPFENVSKRMSKRTKLNLSPKKSEDIFREWLNENVLAWEYVYLTQNKYHLLTGDEDLTAIHMYPFEAPEILPNVPQGGTISSALVCICFPIYKNDYHWGDIPENCIAFQVGSSVSSEKIFIHTQGMERFYALNNNRSNVYARKYSFVSPFEDHLGPNNCEIDAHNNLIYRGSVSCKELQTGYFSDRTDFQKVGVIYKEYQTSQYHLSNEYSIDKKLTFNKNEVVGALKDIKFNPKLLSQQFYELNVVIGGQKFSYDAQKLNKEKLKIAYNEALTPDITKGYARIYDTSGVYIKQCEENLTGLVYTNDNSLMVDNDKLSEMLANNKNFFLQQGLNIGKAVGESVSAIISGRWDKPVQTLFGMVDQSLSIGNMRNAPHQVSNANGNVYFNALISNYLPHIEEYDLLDVEKQVVNDLMFQNGFAFNKIDNIGNYDNIRHFFNYIEAEVENISAPISNTEKERLKTKLKMVRFWNSDTIQYDYENYENSLVGGEEDA